MHRKFLPGKRVAESGPVEQGWSYPVYPAKQNSHRGPTGEGNAGSCFRNLSGVYLSSFLIYFPPTASPVSFPLSLRLATASSCFFSSTTGLGFNRCFRYRRFGCRLVFLLLLLIGFFRRRGADGYILYPAFFFIWRGYRLLPAKHCVVLFLSSSVGAGADMRNTDLGYRPGIPFTLVDVVFFIPAPKGLCAGTAAASAHHPGPCRRVFAFAGWAFPGTVICLGIPDHLMPLFFPRFHFPPRGYLPEFAGCSADEALPGTGLYRRLLPAYHRPG